MQSMVEERGRTDWLRAINKYFEIAETSSYENLPEETRRRIEATDETLKSFCKEICAEAINRDFCSYVSTGETGNVGRETFNALRNSVSSG